MSAPTGFDAWKITTTIKMHFQNEKYDAFRFNFKAKNLTFTAFENRNDRYFFEKLAKTYPKSNQLRQYVFSNIVYDDQVWIGSMKDEPYNNYCKRIQSFGYLFQKDLSHLTDTESSLNKLLTSTNGNIPPLVMSFLRGETMFESVVTINLLTNFMSYAKKKVTDDLLWPSIHLKIDKAGPFIRQDIDLDKTKKIIINHFSSVQPKPIGV